MTNRQRMDKLELVAALIEQVRASLDPQDRRCRGCGRKHAARWLHHIARKELEGAWGRVQRVMKTIDAVGDDFDLPSDSDVNLRPAPPLPQG